MQRGKREKVCTAAERDMDSARYQFATIAELLEISMLAILGPLSIYI